MQYLMVSESPLIINLRLKNLVEFQCLSSLLFQFQMGNVKTSETYDMLEYYRFINEQNDLKIYERKIDQEQFILKEQTFANKQQYERVFRMYAQRDNLQSSDYMTKFAKFWSTEQIGFCSNLFKIFTVYQYPKITLTEEIRVRSVKQNYLEEVQIFSIIQSCIIAFCEERAYIHLSPEQIFIMPEGNLKLLHYDLLDQNVDIGYNSKYYYSPQKFENFATYSMFNLEIQQKQTVFALGLTILHASTLVDPIDCYEVSFKKFNRKKLKDYLNKLKQIYSQQLQSLITKMLAPSDKRLKFDELSQIVNKYLQNDKHKSITSFSPTTFSNNETFSYNQKKSDNKPIKQFVVRQSLSSNYLLQKHVTKSQFQIVFDDSKRQSLAVLSKKDKGLPIPIEEKENVLHKNKPRSSIFTDPRIMEIIKSGIQKINKSKQSKNVLSQNSSILNKATSVDAKQHNQNNTTLLLDFSFKLLPQNNPKCIFVNQIYQDGTRFEGMLKNTLKHGYGKLTYLDGVYYEGNFKENMLHGKGVLYYGSNRPAYNGQWKMNRFNGSGILYNQFPVPLFHSFDYHDFNLVGDYWLKYQGCFVDDVKQGQGKIILTNGQMLEGIFCKGIIHGYGVFTDINGNQIKGHWQDNKLTAK